MKVEMEIHADGDIYLLKEDGYYHYAGTLCSEDEDETALKAEAWLINKQNEVWAEEGAQKKDKEKV